MIPYEVRLALPEETGGKRLRRGAAPGGG